MVLLIPSTQYDKGTAIKRLKECLKLRHCNIAKNKNCLLENVNLTVNRNNINNTICLILYDIIVMICSSTEVTVIDSLHLVQRFLPHGHGFIVLR